MIIHDERDGYLADSYADLDVHVENGLCVVTKTTEPEKIWKEVAHFFPEDSDDVEVEIYADGAIVWLTPTEELLPYFTALYLLTEGYQALDIDDYISYTSDANLIMKREELRENRDDILQWMQELEDRRDW